MHDWHEIIFAKCGRRGRAVVTYEKLKVSVKLDIACAVMHQIDQDFVDIMRAKEFTLKYVIMIVITTNIGKELILFRSFKCFM